MHYPGGPTEIIRLYYKVRENETIQYVDVMRLHPYISKYFKFPIGQPVFRMGDTCKDKEACLRMFDRAAREAVSPGLPFQKQQEAPVLSV